MGDQTTPLPARYHTDRRSTGARKAGTADTRLADGFKDETRRGITEAMSIDNQRMSRFTIRVLTVASVALLIQVAIGSPVRAAIPAVPANPTPGSTSSPGPTVSSSTVGLDWSNSSGATFYDLGVRDLVTNQLVVDTQVSNSAYTANLEAGKPYRWNVAACNASGCSAFTAQLYFQTPAAIPGVPANPTPGSTTSPGPTVSSSTVGLDWSNSTSATFYDLGVRDLVTNQLVVDTQVSSSAFTANLEPGKPYRWDVAACNSAGCSSPTADRYFQTPAAIPAVPANPTPGSTTSPGPTLASATVGLDWSNSTSATFYDLGVRDLVTNQLVVDTQVSSSAYTANLEPGKPYRWDVAACNSAGCSSPTADRYFQTPAVVVVCFVLTKTHIGSGSNPQVSPANSTGCPAGQYVAGAQLQLSASPDSGWSVGSWSGTGNNSSTSATNQVNMPSSSHTVGVNYVQVASPPNLDVLEISLFEPRYPDAAPDEIPIGGAGTTVDGNPVTIRARIKNFGGAGSVAVRWTVDGQVIPSGSGILNFSQNQERTLEKIWDTSGVAWDSDGNAIVQARDIQVEAVGHDAESVELLVRPRPLILVHGLWSDAETWEAYGPIGLGPVGGFVGEAHPLWQSYAVGDGFVPDLAMNTGNLWCAAIPCTIWTYEENARVLGVYLGKVRQATNAWSVDILAHSMGGLISREYIYRFMQLAPTLPGLRPVKNLVTLGTPHLGTPCSRYANTSGVWLSEEYVQSHFAGFPLHGVALHTMGSGISLNCPVGLGNPITVYDPVVNLGSALFEGFADSSTVRFSLHTSMTSSRDEFEEFVWPLLAGQEPERGAETPSVATDAETTGTNPAILLHSGQTALTEGNMIVSTIQVPAGNRLAVLVLAGDGVDLRLRGPGGQLPAEQGGAPFRYFELPSPQAGAWRLEIASFDGNPPLAEFSWYLEGSVYSSQLDTGTVEGATRLRVTPRRNGLPVTGALTTVEVVSTAGNVTTIQLFDDGQHADLLPNDGVYGQVASLAPDAYQCRARSMIDGFAIGSTAVVIVQGGAIFADGFESGDLSAWSVVGPVGTHVVFFSDNFNDGVLDPDRWTWYGNTVRETGGQLHVDCEVTDQGGGINTQYFPIAPTGLVTFSRMARVGAGNHKFDGTLRFEFGDDESNYFGISYADYDNSGNGECPVQGFALYRNGANSHYCSTQGVDVTPFIPGLWGTWFQEKLEWDPATGQAAYYIDNQNVLNLDVGQLPAGIGELRLRMSTWGWHTGHYQHSDEVRFIQEAQ
jgi:pimeloyl-ACP methyl ester carboxylesterase